MLLRPTTHILVLLSLLALTAAPVGAAPPNECKLPAQPDLANHRLGRQCVTLTLPDPACLPVGAVGALDFGTSTLCTVYIVLVPFNDGGRPTAEFDPWIVYAESNGVPGLQTTGQPGQYTHDHPIIM